MTRLDVLAAIGATGVREVSDNTTVIEFARGGARPATTVEKRLLGLLLGTPSSR